MVSRQELDKALFFYKKNLDYIDRLVNLDIMAFNDDDADEKMRECTRNAQRKQGMQLKRDMRRVTEIIGAINVILAAYKEGDMDTKDKIEIKLSSEYLGGAPRDLRVEKRLLENMVKERGVQYVPSIPRKAKRAPAKTRARATVTPKPAAKKPAPTKRVTDVSGQFKKITGIKF